LDRGVALRGRERGLNLSDDHFSGVGYAPRPKEFLLSRSDLPPLDGEFLRIIATRVLGEAVEEPILAGDPRMAAAVVAVEALARLYRHCEDRKQAAWRYAGPILGPWETMSEGTDVWMAFLAAVRDLYDLKVGEFKSLLVTIRDRGLAS